MRRSTRIAPFALDLHVLGTPPAFVLSQDQTLQRKSCLELSQTTQRSSEGYRNLILRYSNELQLPAELLGFAIQFSKSESTPSLSAFSNRCSRTRLLHYCRAISTAFFRFRLQLLSVLLSAVEVRLHHSLPPRQACFDYLRRCRFKSNGSTTHQLLLSRVNPTAPHAVRLPAFDLRLATQPTCPPDGPSTKGRRIYRPAPHESTPLLSFF